MPVLRADFGACQGYANCVDAAPEAYDIDDDGVVVLLKEQISDEERQLRTRPKRRRSR